MQPLLTAATVRRLFFQRSQGSHTACFCTARAPLPELEEAGGRFLSPAEQTLLQGLKFNARRASFLLGRYCAKEALALYFGQPDRRLFDIVPGVFQQPVVKGPGTQSAQVSLSHSGSWGAAVAFDETHPMAVDLEEIALDRRETIQSQLTPAERRLLDGCPGDTDSKLALAWTAKEALSKALKTGMMAPFSIYELESFAWESDCLLSHFKSFGQYRAIGFTFQNLALTMVLPRKSAPAGSLAEFRRSLAPHFPEGSG